jgi:two-component system, NarL family, invasion response regulator UvrY
MVNVVIADDHRLVREAWALLLKRDKRISITGIVDNGRDVIDFCRRNSPDIILMDINMEPTNGVDATKEIRSFNDSVKIIGISVHSDLSYVNTLIQAGANGYVTKNSSGTEMLQAIFEVMDGKQYICKEISESGVSSQ